MQNIKYIVTGAVLLYLLHSLWMVREISACRAQLQATAKQFRADMQLQKAESAYETLCMVDLLSKFAEDACKAEDELKKQIEGIRRQVIQALDIYNEQHGTYPVSLEEISDRLDPIARTQIQHLIYCGPSYLGAKSAVCPDGMSAADAGESPYILLTGKVSHSFKLGRGEGAAECPLQ